MKRNDKSHNTLLLYCLRPVLFSYRMRYSDTIQPVQPFMAATAVEKAVPISTLSLQDNKQSIW